MQRLELAFTVPPAVGQRFELGDFGAVDVAHWAVLKSLAIKLQAASPSSKKKQTLYAFAFSCRS